MVSVILTTNTVLYITVQAVRTSQLLRLYGEVDQRVKVLVVVFKYWAKVSCVYMPQAVVVYVLWLSMNSNTCQTLTNSIMSVQST